jgi:hypothetical protein
MTPNGWGCKCWVRQITRREAERRGISAEPKVRDTVWTNPRTGEALIVPEGIDPGWQRNPGKQRSQAIEAILNGKLAALPPEIARVAARDIATSWRAARVLQGAAGGAVPVGVLPTAVAEQVGSPGTVVQMTDSYGTKFVSRDRDVTVEVLGVLEDALWTGQMAVEKTAQGSSLVVFSRGERPWRFVLKLLPERGEIWVQTIHRTKPGKWLSFTKRDGVTVVRE